MKFLRSWYKQDSGQKMMEVVVWSGDRLWGWQEARYYVQVSGMAGKHSN